MSNHPFVVIEDPIDGEDVEIDEMLAPLIAALWDGRIEPVSCCQQQGDFDEEFLTEYPHLADRYSQTMPMAYIDFFDTTDVAIMMDMIWLGDPGDTIKNRMDHWLYEGAWNISASFRRSPVGPFHPLCYQVTFPQQDISEMTEALQRGVKIMRG